MMASLFVIGLAAVAATVFSLRSTRAMMSRFVSLIVGTSALAALTLAPVAGAVGPQAPLFITNSSLSAPYTTVVKLTTTGGSGAGAVSFKATGANCVVDAKKNTLSAKAPTTCSVVATKAASGTFAAASSSAVVFTFTGKAQATLSVANTVLTSLVGTKVVLTSKGGSGTGAVSYLASGTSCSYTAKTFTLTAATYAKCSVVATKAASGSYASASSQAVVFTFVPTKFSIVNTVFSGTVGTSITVVAAGGTAKGTTQYSVTGTGCSINSSTGVLNASQAATCAASAALVSGGKTLATATAVNFTFILSENPTVATPDVATLTSVSGTSGAQIDDTANGRSYFINQYYNNNDHWYGNYIHNGATVKVTWHVAGSSGQPLANAAVTLHGNLGYSNAQGVTWQESSLNQYPGGGPSPEGTLGGTTDANGNVTFTLHNQNNDSGPVPSDTTTTAGMESNEGPYSWTDMLLQVGSDIYTGDPHSNINQATDRVDFIVLPTPAALTAPTKAHPDVATLTSVTGGINSTPLDCTNLAGTCDGDSWFINQYFNPANHWNMTYVTAGSTVTENWHVVDYNGNAMKNATVTLVTNHENNADGANWTAAGIDSNGYVTGTTDASGNVSFTLTNTDNTGAGSTPANTTDSPKALAYENNGNPFIRTVLIVGTATSVNGSATDSINGAATQATDFVDLLVTPAVSTPPASGPTKTNPDVASLTSITGGQNSTPIDCTNVTDVCDGDSWFINQYYNPANHWNFTYVTAGSTITENWHVVDYNGNAMKNQTVTLALHHDGPDADNWTATGLTQDKFISGTTDSNGNVSFTITNTDSVNYAAPANTSDPGTALSYENGHQWTRTALIVGTATGINGSSTDHLDGSSNQATDFVELLVTP